MSIRAATECMLVFRHVSTRMLTATAQMYTKRFSSLTTSLGRKLILQGREPFNHFMSTGATEKSLQTTSIGELSCLSVCVFCFSLQGR